MNNLMAIAGNADNKEFRSYFGTVLQQQQMLTLQQTMEENFCRNMKLEEFAKLSLRSLSSFKRDFQQLYNTSPGKWLREKRLAKAWQLLGHFGKTVSEAAFETGFENVSHFSRAFRQRFGNSPVSMRQRAAVISFSAEAYSDDKLLPAV